jgi:hypothetical protein
MRQSGRATAGLESSERELFPLTRRLCAWQLYDVQSFDLSFLIELPFEPTCVEWIYTAAEPHGRLVVADLDSPLLRVYRTDGGTEPVHVLASLHTAPVSERERHVCARFGWVKGRVPKIG